MFVSSAGTSGRGGAPPSPLDATWERVLDYCTRSANPVGRLVLAVHGIRDPQSVAASDAICTGLQLTNFWQDVAIDLDKDQVRKLETIGR